MAEIEAERPPSLPVQPTTEDEAASNSDPNTSFAFPYPPPHSSSPDLSQRQNDQPPNAPTEASHSRASSSIHKLPDFSFNPGAFSAAPINEPPNSSSASIAISAQDSPNRGRRHRRSASEFVGGSSTAPAGSGLQPVKVDFSGGPTFVSQAESFNLQSSLRHDTQHKNFDLKVPDNASPPNLTGTQTTPGSEEYNKDVQKGLASSNQTYLPSVTPSSSRVLFAETVEVIPWSTAEVSTNREASSSPERKDEGPGSDDAKLQHLSDIKSSNVLEEPLQSHWSHTATAAERSSSATFRIPMPDTNHLDENFDNDPTGSEELSIDGAHQYRPTPFAPTGLSTKSYVPRTNVAESGMIDLDEALAPTTYDRVRDDDQRISQGKTFESARRSMHSSGVVTGFTGPAMHFHRRAESAPLLAPINFDRSLDASGVNRVMENVFEEEEEAEEEEGEREKEEDDFSPTPFLSNYPTTQEVELQRYEAGLGISVQSISPEAAATEGPHEVKDKQSISIVATNLDKELAAKSEDAKEQPGDEVELTLPQAPFTTPDTPSGSSFSSPRRHHFSLASSVPSLVFPHSTDDVPSLVSSRSTIASGALVYQYGVGLPTATSRLSQTSTYGRIEEQRRKRSSIASLTRLIGTSQSDSKSFADSEDARQNLDGLVPVQRPRPARLKRLFALWHRKDNAGKG